MYPLSCHLGLLPLHLPLTGGHATVFTTAKGSAMRDDVACTLNQCAASGSRSCLRAHEADFSCHSPS